MRKRNLWKAAGIMAAGVLTVNMACGGTSSVYASETKIAASADRETQKEKSEKTESVTPVLLLDKDGKPVPNKGIKIGIITDGRPEGQRNKIESFHSILKQEIRLLESPVDYVLLLVVFISL